MPMDPYAVLRALLRAEAARDTRAEQRPPKPQQPAQPQARQEKETDR
ncbi:hypothetical protein [Streptomyces sp. VRA16 Mangrove soil]|nr:hypothetical protein [Streptomyces sp. VRA16 Mangrove soil]MBO1337334.1 hypothetical protein [Streptomyces sp. VRA16 Mangrove soil]